MARNDRLLLDSVIDRASAGYGPNRQRDQYFELFAFDHVLHDRLLTLDELESGWVDGTNDGGIDGIFFFADDSLVTEPLEEADVRRGAELSVHVITAKLGDSFREPPITSLHASLTEWFDLEKSTDSLKYPFTPSALQIRDIFRKSYLATATKHPSLRISISYACRGDVQTVNDALQARMSQVADAVRSLFTRVTVEAELLGAAELLELSRRQRTTSRRLRINEYLTSRDGTNYVLLVRLRDFFAFVSDASGRLAVGLLESNVRDYVGDTGINREIALSLRDRATARPDFWWLNNGITMLASSAMVAGGELILENAQIVNGLQTTYSINEYLRNGSDAQDERSVLVRVVVSADDEVRDRIIKATNFQNPVPLASLRATDRVQRNIEQFLLSHGWYYDRRPGYYRGVGQPADRVLSPAYVGAAVSTLLHKRLMSSKKTKWMRSDSRYRAIFSDRTPLEAYRICVEVFRWVSAELRIAGIEVLRDNRGTFVALVALVLVAHKLGGAGYTQDQLLALSVTAFRCEDLDAAVQWVRKRYEPYYSKRGWMPPLEKGITYNKFVDYCVKELRAEVG